VAIVSYLRSQPPVPVPAHGFTVLPQIVKTTVRRSRSGRQASPHATPHGATIEQQVPGGSVALCWACHTQRDV
jgi:hypothetical protein